MTGAAGRRRGKFRVLSQREISKAFEAKWNRDADRRSRNDGGARKSESTGTTGTTKRVQRKRTGKTPS
jgi:hypothetical protein